MIFAIFFLLMSDINFVNFEPGIGDFISMHPIDVTESGRVMAITDRELLVWQRNGAIAFKWAAPKGKIGAAIELGNQYLLSYVGEEGKSFTTLVDTNGKILLEAPFFTHNFQMNEGTLFGFPVTDAVIGGRTYPPIFVEINLGDQIDFRKSGPMSMTQRMIDLRFNFKKAWILSDTDHVYVVNEIEPKVFTFSKQEFAQDRRYFNLPDKVPFLDLPLAGFEPVRDVFKPPQGIHLYEKVKKMMAAWWHSFSTIKGFDKYGDGYLIAYTTPVCEDGNCFASHLVLQRLSPEFSPVGQPEKFVDSYYAGVWQDRVQIFEPNFREHDGTKEMHPVLKSINLLATEQ